MHTINTDQDPLLPCCAYTRFPLNSRSQPAGLTGDIYDGLLAALAKEPYVQERDQMMAELPKSPRMLRKEMVPRC